MRKIITGAIKDTIENAALIWILFFANIFVSYIAYGFGFRRSVVITALFSVSIIYLFSVVLQALLLYRAGGNWPFGKIFHGGLTNFPVMLGWILIPAALAAAAVLISSRIFKGHFYTAGPLVFFAFAYVLGPAAVSLYDGGRLKESFKTAIGLMGRETLAWILGAVFIIVLLILTGLASEFLTSAAAVAVRGQRKIMGAAYICAAEFIKSASVVAILATMVRLYAGRQRKNEIVEQK